MWQYNNELYHHGVKGQKWGIRRYQNPDGTLTVAGQKHYTKKASRLSKLANRSSYDELRYEKYKDQFNRADKLARSRGPMFYGRWYASAATQSQKQYMVSLGKRAMRSDKKVRNYMNKLSDELENSDYTLGYDFVNYNLIKRSN